MTYSSTKKIMWTEITITIFSKENCHKDIENTFEIFQSLEEEFSRFLVDSSLCKLNTERTLKVSGRFIDVIHKCKEIYADSDFYFNPLINLKTIGYSKDFDRHEFKKEETKVNLEFEKVEIVWNTMSLQEWQILDLGWIVKGYAVDKANEYLESKWYKDYIIDAGGDIYIAWIADDWKKTIVGIDSPFVKWDLLATLEIGNKSIATSGTYKRKWEIEWKEYNHIINPLTSMNTEEIVSITLIDVYCYRADAYATACIAMGLEKTLSFVKKKQIDAVIVCTNKKTYTTEGMKKYNIQFI